MWGDNLIVVLICIFLIISDVEHLFMCQVAWPSVCRLWRNVHLGLLPIFQLDCLVCCCWIIWAVCTFWRVKPLTVESLVNIFPHPLVVFSFLLLFLWFPLLCKNVWVWLGPICLFFFLFLLPWETDLRKHCHNLCQRIFCLCSLLGVSWCHTLYLSL